MTHKLSVYVLTHNSETHLQNIITMLLPIADELLIIDSGSNDATQKITAQFPDAKFIQHAFTSFKAQRLFAEKTCQHNLIMFIDSDEIPNKELIQAISNLKQQTLKHHAYHIERHWTALGQPIHALYPVSSPDHPIRLYDKLHASFKTSSLVHEGISGQQSTGSLAGYLTHITFQSKQEIHTKLLKYTDLAANDLLEKGKKTTPIKQLMSAICSFIKWYFIKQGYRDGITGLILAKYAYDYTWLKYKKARKKCKAT